MSQASTRTETPPKIPEMPEMPFLRNVGLVMTYKCQARCPHCIIEAGPDRKEEVLLDDAYNWIDQIAHYRQGYIKVLSLTGGEPFYNLDKLQRISSYGEKLGLMVSAVTNACWATNPQKAEQTLRDLPSIRMLAISTDVYHQLYIPLGRVENAIQAAKRSGIPYTVAVCTENEEETGYRKIMERLERITDRSTITTAITFPAGRALQEIGGMNHEITQEVPVSACAAGSSPILFPDGRVVACIGPVISLTEPHPLLLGSLRDNDLATILDRAESNPVLHAIRIWGPKKLIILADKAGLSDNLPQHYIKDSVCSACYALMSNDTIIRYLTQLSADPEFVRRVAYGRVYYLHETSMLERTPGYGVSGIGGINEIRGVQHVPVLHSQDPPAPAAGRGRTSHGSLDVASRASGHSDHGPSTAARSKDGSSTLQMP